MLEVQERRDCKIKRGEIIPRQSKSSEPRLEIGYIYYRPFIIA